MDVVQDGTTRGRLTSCQSVGAVAAGASGPARISSAVLITIVGVRGARLFCWCKPGSQAGQRQAWRTEDDGSRHVAHERATWGTAYAAASHWLLPEGSYEAYTAAAQ